MREFLAFAGQRRSADTQRAADVDDLRAATAFLERMCDAARRAGERLARETGGARRDESPGGGFSPAACT
ncbi:hypothetical protein ACFPM7_15285 [Actinokineospora guangxiensis]|uniref:Uncharacterized protein n=1 Tax=Actinokineospora guangxiensis TaxID=1490288 RepID=A0ABW0EQS2_9PSEU